MVGMESRPASDGPKESENSNNQPEVGRLYTEPLPKEAINFVADFVIKQRDQQDREEPDTTYISALFPDHKRGDEDIDDTKNLLQELAGTNHDETDDMTPASLSDIVKRYQDKALLGNVIANGELYALGEVSRALEASPDKSLAKTGRLMALQVASIIQTVRPDFFPEEHKDRINWLRTKTALDQDIPEYIQDEVRPRKTAGPTNNDNATQQASTTSQAASSKVEAAVLENGVSTDGETDTKAEPKMKQEPALNTPRLGYMPSAEHSWPLRKSNEVEGVIARQDVLQREDLQTINHEFSEQLKANPLRAAHLLAQMKRAGISWNSKASPKASAKMEQAQNALRDAIETYRQKDPHTLARYLTYLKYTGVIDSVAVDDKTLIRREIKEELKAGEGRDASNLAMYAKYLGAKSKYSADEIERLKKRSMTIGNQGATALDLAKRIARLKYVANVNETSQASQEQLEPYLEGLKKMHEAGDAASAAKLAHLLQQQFGARVDQLNVPWLKESVKKYKMYNDWEKALSVIVDASKIKPPETKKTVTPYEPQPVLWELSHERQARESKQQQAVSPHYYVDTNQVSYEQPYVEITDPSSESTEKLKEQLQRLRAHKEVSSNSPERAGAAEVLKNFLAGSQAHEDDRTTFLHSYLDARFLKPNRDITLKEFFSHPVNTVLAKMGLAKEQQDERLVHKYVDQYMSQDLRRNNVEQGHLKPGPEWYNKARSAVMTDLLGFLDDPRMVMTPQEKDTWQLLLKTLEEVQIRDELARRLKDNAD